jgi:hypothetical protein
MQLLGSKGSSGGGDADERGHGDEPTTKKPAPTQQDFDDDIPF